MYIGTLTWRCWSALPGSCPDRRREFAGMTETGSGIRSLLLSVVCGMQGKKKEMKEINSFELLYGVVMLECGTIKIGVYVVMNNYSTAEGTCVRN